MSFAKDGGASKDRNFMPRHEGLSPEKRCNRDRFSIAFPFNDRFHPNQVTRSCGPNPLNVNALFVLGGLAGLALTTR
jgi:hypothetical protein